MASCQAIRADPVQLHLGVRCRTQPGVLSADLDGAYRRQAGNGRAFAADKMSVLMRVVVLAGHACVCTGELVVGLAVHAIDDSRQTHIGQRHQGSIDCGRITSDRTKLRRRLAAGKRSLLIRKHCQHRKPGAGAPQRGTTQQRSRARCGARLGRLIVKVLHLCLSATVDWRVARPAILLRHRESLTSAERGKRTLPLSTRYLQATCI